MTQRVLSFEECKRLAKTLRSPTKPFFDTHWCCVCVTAHVPHRTHVEVRVQLERASSLLPHVLGLELRLSGLVVSAFCLLSHLAVPQYTLVFVHVLWCLQILKTQSVHVKLYLALRLILYIYPGLIHHYSMDNIKGVIKFKSYSLKKCY